MRIGLTGGIGSGKSTVAGLLTRLGATVIDTDAVARRLTSRGGAAMPALQQAFGPEIADADGALDRAAMRVRAFSDAQAKRRLEAVLHPLIGAEALRQAAAVRGGVVVFDVPLLAESRDWRERVERVLVIDCSEATQLARVSQRAGWTAAMARLVMDGQASRAARRAIADAVIFNDGMKLDALDDAVERLWKLWQLAPQIAVEQ
jgi:dephospho-CoA kinase